MNINVRLGSSWGICLGFISLVIQYWKKKKHLFDSSETRQFRDVPGLSSERTGDCTIGLGSSAQRSGQKVSTCKAWYLMRLPCSSSRPNPTFSSQPIRLWDRMIRMIQETQETTDHLDFLWNIKTVIHWNLWGWQLGTVRSTSASVGVPGALSCVCHMSHMSYSVFAKRNEIQNFADLRCSKTVKWYFLQCQSGGNIRDDGRIQVWTR